MPPIVRAVAWLVLESVIQLNVSRATSSMLTVRPVNLVLQTAAPVQRLVHIDVMTAWKDSFQIEAVAWLLMVLSFMVLAVLALHFAKSAIVPLAIVLPASQGMCSILRDLELDV